MVKNRLDHISCDELMIFIVLFLSTLNFITFHQDREPTLALHLSREGDGNEMVNDGLPREKIRDEAIEFFIYGIEAIELTTIMAPL